MSQQYYVDIAGQKDGPHDLVTIMRRIRAKKIGPETGIYAGDDAFAVPAAEIEDIALFFSRQINEPASQAAALPNITLHGVLHDGWRFMIDHSVMTVFSGGMLLLSLLIAATMIQGLGFAIGSYLSWIVFTMCHYFYMVCALRLYRGQSFSFHFINQQLGPVLPMILFSAIVIALMMIGGFSLLVIPGVAVAIYYVFVPFLIFDRRMSLVEAMHGSRLLVQKHNRRYQSTIGMLMLMHIACLMLIIPIPITLPMFSAGIAKLYEELSSS